MGRRVIFWCWLGCQAKSLQELFALGSASHPCNSWLLNSVRYWHREIAVSLALSTLRAATLSRMMKTKSEKVASLLPLPRLCGRGIVDKRDQLEVFDLRRVKSCETRMDRRYSTDSTVSFLSDVSFVSEDRSLRVRQRNYDWLLPMEQDKNEKIHHTHTHSHLMRGSW